MSEIKGRCRAAIGILEAARTLIESASVEASAQVWTGNERDKRTALKSIERMQQRLLLRHDGDVRPNE